eukprot:FR737080.1.p1 GENE.FR737080.1~~FR737080.1.p1  ORF type:complete len:224 (+),score=21.07 FR737080.1:140-811(+)
MLSGSATVSVFLLAIIVLPTGITCFVVSSSLVYKRKQLRDIKQCTLDIMIAMTVFSFICSLSLLSMTSTSAGIFNEWEYSTPVSQAYGWDHTSWYSDDWYTGFASSCSGSNDSSCGTTDKAICIEEEDDWYDTGTGGSCGVVCSAECNIVDGGGWWYDEDDWQSCYELEHCNLESLQAQATTVPCALAVNLVLSITLLAMASSLKAVHSKIKPDQTCCSCDSC